MLKLFSPAKLNLFLRILRKREDGYHELASLFHAISLGDTLHFIRTEDERDSLSSEGIPIPLDKSNLIYRALRLFREKTGSTLHARVHVNKRIPLDAGLGGGSSNASTTLWAMNELSGRVATIKQLTEWGAELGSDVSFFFSEGTAYCTGRGEILRSLPPLPQNPHFTLVKPSFGLSTPHVYRMLKVDALPLRDPQATLDQFYSSNPCYFNDLEISAFHISPELKQLQEKLIQSGFQHAILAGSGSSLFCIGEGKFLPQDLYKQKVSGIRRNPGSWYTC